MQNGFVESLIGRFRDECLNEHLFRSLPAARRPNVSTSTRSGSAPSATRAATASTRTVVLPVPGPPTTSNGPPVCATTAACRSSSSGGGPVGAGRLTNRYAGPRVSTAAIRPRRYDDRCDRRPPARPAQPRTASRAARTRQLSPGRDLVRDLRVANLRFRPDDPLGERRRRRQERERDLFGRQAADFSECQGYLRIR